MSKIKAKVILNTSFLVLVSALIYSLNYGGLQNYSIFVSIIILVLPALSVTVYSLIVIIVEMGELPKQSKRSMRVSLFLSIIFVFYLYYIKIYNPESNIAISTQAIIISTLFTTHYLVHKTTKEISGESFKVVLTDVLAFQTDDSIETKITKQLRTTKLMLIVSIMAFNGLNNMITIISVIGYILLTVSEFIRYYKIFKEREIVYIFVLYCLAIEFLFLTGAIISVYQEKNSAATLMLLFTGVPSAYIRERVVKDNEANSMIMSSGM